MSATRLLVRDLAQLVTPAGRDAPLRGPALGAVEVIEDAYVLCTGETIDAVGRMRELPAVETHGRTADHIDGHAFEGNALGLHDFLGQRAQHRPDFEHLGLAAIAAVELQHLAHDAIDAAAVGVHDAEELA